MIFDGVIIPGGFSLDYMRKSKDSVNFLKDLNKQENSIGAICHVKWMISEDLNLEIRKLISTPTTNTDPINAGANWLDEEVVVDKNLVTPGSPKDLPAFVKKIINLVK